MNKRNWRNSILLLTTYYLTIIVCVQSAPETDLVKNLPDYPYKGVMYSGYLDSNEVKKLHYVFVPSDNKANPLVVWLNGGPGCSSMMGFLTEHGPSLLLNMDTQFTLNEYSWHKNAHMLYIESPAGVGFSYSENGEKDYYFNDQNSADDNLTALLSFFTKFPEYKENDFFITGESYGGIYVPNFAYRVIKYNSNKPSFVIKLKGIAIGNGLVDWNVDFESALIEFAYNHFIITEKEVKLYHDNCKGPGLVPQNCVDAKAAIKKVWNGLNIYDILQECPKITNSSDEVSAINTGISQAEQTINVINKVRQFKTKSLLAGRFTEDQIKDHIDFSIWPDGCGSNPTVWKYLNRADVKVALNVKDIPWIGCSPIVAQRYEIDYRGTIYLFPEIISSGVKILKFTGDTDAAVPYTGTIRWIDSLKLDITKKYKSFSTKNQVSGFVQEYKGLRYATIKGTGHMAPGWKREACFNLFNDFIAGK